MVRVPKKNISPWMSDVKPPDKDKAVLQPPPQPPAPDVPQVRSAFSRTHLVLGVMLLGLFIGAGVLYAKTSRRFYVQDAPSAAAVPDTWLGDLQKNFSTYKLQGQAALRLLALSRDAASINEALPGYVQGKNSAELISILRSTDKDLGNFAADIKDLPPDSPLFDFLPAAWKRGNLADNVKATQDFTQSLLAWFAPGKKINIAVFFQNPSELRPAGGFIGSYAEMNIVNGAVQGLKVRDINEVDRTLKTKIASPPSMRSFSPILHARDANWFLNFPESAEGVLRVMEQSGLYSASSTHFAAALAVSPKVISDILAVTGPVHLSNPDINIDSQNFLIEIQKSVEDSRAEANVHPKQILGRLMPLVLARLEGADSARRAALLDDASNWMKNKDVMLYARDANMQKFFESYGWAGKLAALPDGFAGDYFALAFANLASGKTDIFIKRSIDFESFIAADGKIKDSVKINEEHVGALGGFAWYTAPNKSYIKLYAPQDASSAGNLYMESDKRLIVLSRTIKLNQAKVTVASYEHRLPQVPKNGGEYRFLFDKQPGLTAQYHFSLHAPPGFVWRENGAATYVYDSAEPPGQMEIKLTFKKI